jgi:hypothetical protein
MTLHHDYNESPKFRQKRRELTIDPDLSANFSIEELNTALLALKSGKLHVLMVEFTRNLLKVLAQGPKNGSSPFLMIF